MTFLDSLNMLGGIVEKVYHFRMNLLFLNEELLLIAGQALFLTMKYLI